MLVQITTPRQAIERLIEGNRRFYSGTPHKPNHDIEHASRLGREGQNPFAAILHCSDSRSPAELIFDCGIGDLFVVRIAGNIATEAAIASLEFAVDALGVKAVVVMGHTRCGAVGATLSVENPAESGNILLQHIAKPVTDARAANADEGKLADEATELNAKHGAAEILSRSELIRNHKENGKLELHSAVYDVESCEVRWLD